MPNYQNGKIYKIVDNTNDNVYIGSTTLKPSQRLVQHRSGYKSYCKNTKLSNVKSFDIIKNKDYDIVLMENYPCSTKEELHARERYYIEQNVCVNKTIPCRTDKEYDQYYRTTEKCKQYRKE
jgi:predicted GIY-YIG superfamily endonuclease